MAYEIVVGLIVLVIIMFVIVRAIWKSVEEDNGEGRGQWQTPRPRRKGKRESRVIWDVSLKGNPTVVIDGKRITVFASDEGWKYVIAVEIARDDDEYELPDFSLPYETEEEAKYEALAFIDDRPSRYRSITEQRAEWSDEQWSEYKRQRGRQQRLDMWETEIQEREQLIRHISDLLTREDLNVTALRKPERKIATRLKTLEWLISTSREDGVRAGLIARAERQKNTLRKLAQRVEERIAERKAMRKSPPLKRPPRKAPVSDSQLSSDLVSKVDELIRLFADSPVMEDDERERLWRRASGAPDFLNQDVKSFRAIMKVVDQDLVWQCETVTAAFERYLKTGEIPAPHYPMRVVVLLHKAKDFDRERQFLAAWCNHFLSGNGVTYAALVERAKKTGAIPA